MQKSWEYVFDVFLISNRLRKQSYLWSNSDNMDVHKYMHKTSALRTVSLQHVMLCSTVMGDFKTFTTF